MPERHVGFVLLANSSPTTLTKIGAAGRILWPVILDRQPAAGSEPDTSPPPSAAITGTSSNRPLPPVPVLIERMVAAAGGEAALRRHTSVELRARKTYENHGVAASLRVRAQQPASRVEEEAWKAAGRRIARLRIYFDGNHGGQETTFGQDSVNDAATDTRAPRENWFRELLDLQALYPEARVTGSTKTGGEEAYNLELDAAEGAWTRLEVGVESGLVRRRVTAAGTFAYSEYRKVDGEMVPFLTRIEDPTLGEITIQIEKVRFNRMIPAAVFRALVRK